MIIHWQWVAVAFIGGVTLTLALEIWRRRLLHRYFLVVISLLLVGFGVVGYGMTMLNGETAVFPPEPTPSIRYTLATLAGELPLPQTWVYESTPVAAVTSSPPIEPPQTAVHHLRIPALNLNKPVSAIPLENGTWDVAELGSDVGWLETTAVYPNDEQAMVFVGHMTFASDDLLEQGAFADIPTLPYGSAIILEIGDKFQTYYIDSVSRVSPDNTDALYQESGNTILLLTCTDWNQQAGVYENRLLVRASHQPH